MRNRKILRKLVYILIVYRFKPKKTMRIPNGPIQTLKNVENLSDEPIMIRNNNAHTSFIILYPLNLTLYKSEMSVNDKNVIPLVYFNRPESSVDIFGYNSHIEWNSDDSMICIAVIN